MRSKLHGKGHPLHPMLVAFPIAFIFAALAADALGFATGRPGPSAAGAYLNLAAILTGVLVAVSGVVDYLTIVLPRSSALKRATWHLAVNAGSLGCLALSWAFRNWSTLETTAGVLTLELAAVALVTGGGWLGGTMVYRNQIGVDHRFAHAGKWREHRLSGPPGVSVTVPEAEELKVGQMILLHVGDHRLVLARTQEGFAAFDDGCSHRGGSLADGTLMCNQVQCPWHGSQFDVRNGAVKAGPADQPIRTYRVTQTEGKVRLELPSI